VTRDSDFRLDSAESHVQSVLLDAVSASLRPRHSESVTIGHPREPPTLKLYLVMVHRSRRSSDPYGRRVSRTVSIS
jgi:hypothetical protein